MSRESLKTASDEAYRRIIDRLESVALDFGPNDCPSDGGKAMRNSLCNFACSFFDTVDYYIFDDPADLWSRTNGDLVQNASPHVLFALAGSCHFYLECFQFARGQARRSEALRLCFPDKSIRVILDWLSNVYATFPEVTMQWHQIAVSADSCSSFDENAEPYLEESMADHLGLATVPTIRSWVGFALATGLVAADVDPVEWDATCDKIFAVE